jgi:hypothetical protein
VSGLRDKLAKLFREICRLIHDVDIEGGVGKRGTSQENKQHNIKQKIYIDIINIFYMIEH